MKIISLTFLIPLLFLSCRPAEIAPKAPNPELVHEVFLDLKPGIVLDSIILDIKELEKIPGVHQLNIGEFKDLNDSRALKTDIIFSMKFMDTESYKRYQSHPIHLKLKEKLGPSLAKAPQTVDYILK